MNILIIGDDTQKDEISALPAGEKTTVIFADSLPGIESLTNFDAFFILPSLEEIDVKIFQHKPVFINSVIECLSESGLPQNVGRINAWPGFLLRQLWEVASHSENNIEPIFREFNRQAIVVKDEPGFVAARVISMIINEAFYAFEEKISNMEEIDRAMKLGTNYPWGPFEWAEKIGIQNIYLLLEKLALKEERYKPAPALEKLYWEIKERE
ncbi:MAG TPA: 3-hydroxyacyl-CoA dehydrogenase family protein [Hanamia sp.]|nr:3-hydroxyacyl-CoA dehydrogenase family protein [Hanamia sp.]